MIFPLRIVYILELNSLPSFASSFPAFFPPLPSSKPPAASLLSASWSSFHSSHSSSLRRRLRPTRVPSGIPSPTPSPNRLQRFPPLWPSTSSAVSFLYNHIISKSYILHSSESNLNLLNFCLVSCTASDTYSHAVTSTATSYFLLLSCLFYSKKADSVVIINKSHTLFKHNTVHN